MTYEPDLASLPKSRAEARAAGSTLYFTDVACPKGHLAARYTCDKKCRECKREAARAKYAANAPAICKERRRYRRENKEVVAATSRKIYVRDRAKILLQKKDYQKRTREARRAYGQARYQENKAEVIADRKAYRADNKEKVAAGLRRWHAKNPEYRKLQKANRRAKLREADGTHTIADLRRIRRAQKGRCAYCKKTLGRRAHVDHITPLSAGGSNAASNLQWLCEPCNLSKGAKDPLEFARQEGFLL